MTKAEILRQLHVDVVTKLAPSPIAGVGVFAIKPILENEDPFSGCDNSEYLEFSDAELTDLDPAVMQHVKDMFVHQGGVWYIPEAGVNRIDKSYFLNHSATPNMEADEAGEHFYALRDIAPGEELTVDYRTYDDQPDPFK